MQIEVKLSAHVKRSHGADSLTFNEFRDKGCLSSHTGEDAWSGHKRNEMQHKNVPRVDTRNLI